MQNRLTHPVRWGAAALGVLVLAAGCTPGVAAFPEHDEATVFQQVMEATERQAQCMRDRGWDAQAAGPSQLSMTGHYTTTEARMSDLRECLEAYAYRGVPDMTPDHADAFFAALEESAECLAGLGFTISEPPSRTALVESAMNFDFTLWDPFHEVLTGGVLAEDLTWPDVEARCPPPNMLHFVE